MAEEIDLSNYDPELVDIVRTWVEFCGDLIEVDPRNLNILRQGVRSLGAKADTQFPQLESGELAKLEIADLGHFPLPDEVAELFVSLTGTILFNGADGPRVASEQLEQALDWIRGVLITKGARER